MAITMVPARGQNGLYTGNRPPLVRKPYMELPLGAVKPKGWFEDQMNRQITGLTGHLDELYPLMGDRNGWLGGDGDMWERGPYWIDGLLPLSYIMDDKALQAKVQKWVEWAIASQKEDGFFGPSEDLPPEIGLQRNNAKDWWPRMVVLKFLRQYYDATGDQRVISFMDKYFHYQLKTLPDTPLGNWTFWATERGGDNLDVVYWLYNITGEKYLLELGDLITKQTVDWKGRLTDGKTLSTIYSIHCVNLAQGIKEPVIRYQATGDRSDIDCIDTGYKEMMRFIGFPTGMFGGDEMLHSANPTQGSEFCSAVELMFSLERMIEITGRTDWADWLERIAFNALPTQATDSYDARQYYQQVNQVELSRRQHNFITEHEGTDICFGILTGYPCCTANMHQGWPKFVRHLWMASDDRGLAAICYSPSEVQAKVAEGTVVQITEGGNYPFDDVITFDIKILDKKVKNVCFPLHLRIPGWCEEGEIFINGEEYGKWQKGETAVVCRTWKTGDHVELRLPMKIVISRWYETSGTVERGPLVYALKVGEDWKKVPGNGFGDWFYEVYATTPWNYALLSDTIRPEKLEERFKIEKRDVSGYPWNLENAPLQIRTKGVRIPSWSLYNGMAGPIPCGGQHSTEKGEEEDIILVPYGCTTLRIAEFPVVR